MEMVIAALVFDPAVQRTTTDARSRGGERELAAYHEERRIGSSDFGARPPSLARVSLKGRAGAEILGLDGRKERGKPKEQAAVEETRVATPCRSF